jgi:putative transposase
VAVDQATIPRGVLTSSPRLDEACHGCQRVVGRRWRMDETDIQGKGQGPYLSRAVDTRGQTLDFLRTEPRDEPAAKRCRSQASHRHGVPEKITVEGREATAAAIRSAQAEPGPAMLRRRVRYLHTRLAPDHRGVKRVTRPVLGCTSWDTAQGRLAGIALMQMLKKGQMDRGRPIA